MLSRRQYLLTKSALSGFIPHFRKNGHGVRGVFYIVLVAVSGNLQVDLRPKLVRWDVAG
jgi:hypothetical protein